MSKKIILFMLIILLVAGIVFRVVSLNKDITAEESDFVKPAISFAETEKTTYYHSGQQPNQTGLIHPPMYIYALSTILSFTTSEIAIRSLNVIAILFSAVFIFLFFKKFSEENGNLKGLIASTLFLINFYVLSSSLLIDIDAFSTLFIFGFVYFIILAYKTKLFKYELAAILFLSCSIANRYPIAAIVFAAIFLYFIYDKERREFAIRYFVIGVVAFLLFLIFWMICSLILEPGNFFTFLNHNSNLSILQVTSGIKYYIANFALNIAQIIRLFTLPAIILFVLSLFHFRKADLPTKIIIIYTIASMLLFILIPRPAFGYPRYFLTAMPGFFILITMYIYTSLKEYEFKAKHLSIGILLFLISMFMLIFLSPEPALYQSNGLILATNFPDLFINILCFAGPISLVLFSKKEVKIIVLIAMFLSFNLYFDTQYVMNESHIQEVGKYLKVRVLDNEIVFCPKAIGYYLDKQFYVNDDTKPNLDELSISYIKKYIMYSYYNRKMNDEFFWEEGYYGGLNKPVPAFRDLNIKYVVLYHPVNNTEPERRIGNFYIYNVQKT